MTKGPNRELSQLPPPLLESKSHILREGQCGVKQKREEKERREGVDTEGVKVMRQGVSGGSCHTSREMFQIMLFI